MRFAIITLGCPKNDVDSEHILGKLMEEGWTPVDHPHEADTVIINTCGFIGPAVEESEEEIQNILAYKRSGQIQSVAVGGCLVGRMGSLLVRKFPEVDVFFTMTDLDDLPLLLERRKHGKLSTNRFVLRHRYSRTVTTGAFAYLKIAEGCDRACSFCIIPTIRGRQVSYPVEKLLEEARALVSLGVRELNLVAQDTLRYGTDLGNPDALFHLLDGLETLDELRWVRLFYLHPSGVTPSWVQRIRHYTKVVPYVELPIQHASDRILRHMRRTGGRKAVEEAVEAIRTWWPEAYIRTEVIVGFPTEEEEDFQTLLDFIQASRFERIGIFPYYDEPESLSYRMHPKVPPHEVEARLEELRALAHHLMLDAQNRLVHKTLDVLVEHQGQGRTFWDAPEVDFTVELPDHLPVGDILPVSIEGRTEAGDLIGIPQRDREEALQ